MPPLQTASACSKCQTVRKTDVEASRNPRWETKIMMQEDDEVGNSSNVSHVLIIFKDVQSKLGAPFTLGRWWCPWAASWRDRLCR